MVLVKHAKGKAARFARARVLRGAAVAERTGVLIVDDRVMFRDGLSALVKEQADMISLGVAADGVGAVELAFDLEPDVVLMDINMPRMDGVEATRQITTLKPDIRVIMLTIYGDDDHVFEAIRAGASGYVLKDARSSELLEAIRAVRRGDVIIEPYIASRVLTEFRRLSERPIEVRYTGLTAQERAILQQVGHGRTNKEIAKLLYLAEQTVKNKLSAIYQKLKVNNRAEAALRAAQEGLLREVGGAGQA